jgi:type II secretory pathway component PulF
MIATVLGPGFALALVYPASLVLVVWAVVSIMRQPLWRMSRGRKLAWVWPCVLGWIFLGGIVGGIVAAIYLAGVKPKLPAIQ